MRNPLLVLALSIVLFWSMLAKYAAAEEPDPLALLRGVEESRRALQTGKLEITVRRWLDRPLREDTVFLICEFDGYKRTFHQREREVKVVTKGPLSGETGYKKFAELNYDRDAFVKLGGGTWEEFQTSSAWDGANFSQFGEHFGSASIKKHDHGSVEYMFDPRLLGLVRSRIFFEDTFVLAFPHLQGAKPILDGKEEIDGVLTWRVSINAYGQNDEFFRYWIEPQSFRVYRFEYDSGGAVTRYESSFPKKGIYPSQVIERRYTPEKKLRSSDEMTVTRAEFNIRVAPTVGELGSLNIPVGREVVDERIGRRIGYWDGEKLVDSLPTALDAAAQRKAERDNQKRWRWLALSVSGVVALIAAVVLIRRNFRHSGTTQ